MNQEEEESEHVMSPILIGSSPLIRNHHSLRKDDLNESVPTNLCSIKKGKKSVTFQDCVFPTKQVKPTIEPLSSEILFRSCKIESSPILTEPAEVQKKILKNFVFNSSERSPILKCLDVSSELKKQKNDSKRASKTSVNCVSMLGKRYDEVPETANIKVKKSQPPLVYLAANENEIFFPSTSNAEVRRLSVSPEVKHRTIDPSKCYSPELKTKKIGLNNCSSPELKIKRTDRECYSPELKTEKIRLDDCASPELKVQRTDCSSPELKIKKPFKHLSYSKKQVSTKCNAVPMVISESQEKFECSESLESKTEPLKPVTKTFKTNEGRCIDSIESFHKLKSNVCNKSSDNTVDCFADPVSKEENISEEYCLSPILNKSVNLKPTSSCIYSPSFKADSCTDKNPVDSRQPKSHHPPSPILQSHVSILKRKRSSEKKSENKLNLSSDQKPCKPPYDIKGKTDLENKLSLNSAIINETIHQPQKVNIPSEASSPILITKENVNVCPSSLPNMNKMTPSLQTESSTASLPMHPNRACSIEESPPLVSDILMDKKETVNTPSTSFLPGIRKRLNFSSGLFEKRKSKVAKPAQKLNLKKMNYLENQFSKFSNFCKLNTSLTAKSPSNLSIRKSKMKKFKIGKEFETPKKYSSCADNKCNFDKSPSPVLETSKHTIPVINSKTNTSLKQQEQHSRVEDEVIISDPEIQEDVKMEENSIVNITVIEEKIECASITKKPVLDHAVNGKNIINETIIEENSLSQISKTTDKTLEVETLSPLILSSAIKTEHPPSNIEVSTSSLSQQTHISEVLIQSDDTKLQNPVDSVASASQMNEEILDDSFEFEKKRKRRYKKGTLSAQLHSLLNKTKSEIRMWAYEHKDNSSSTSSIDLVVVSTSYEMKKWFLDCRLLTEQDAGPQSCKFLVILDPCHVNNTAILRGHILKIYPKWHTFDMENPKVTVIFGITRVDVIKDSPLSIIGSGKPAIEQKNVQVQGPLCFCSRDSDLVKCPIGELKRQIIFGPIFFFGKKI